MAPDVVGVDMRSKYTDRQSGQLVRNLPDIADPQARVDENGFVSPQKQKRMDLLPMPVLADSKRVLIYVLNRKPSIFDHLNLFLSEILSKRSIFPPSKKFRIIRIDR
ncbi:hypothetical protein D3C73_1239320 [compost metagenome]